MTDTYTNINGKQEYRRDGLLHRDNDLPAVIQGNRKEWWKEGLRHRDSVSLAPAIMYSDTGQYEYWRDGQHLQELQYMQFPDGRIGCRSPIRN